MGKQLPLRIPVFCILMMLQLQSCQDSSSNHSSAASESALFTTVTPKESGIDFQNKLVESTASNYYKYMYSYIGAGVAAADFNNDGLEDLFFVSNQFDNKLYLNKGNLQFEDISDQAGIKKRPGFDVGVAIADVNDDGYLDIYITRGGWITADNAFANMLYLNNGGSDENGGLPSFTESAAQYGLADNNRGIASVFFDYDRDGDLDLYISNSPDFDDPAAEVVDLTTVPTAASTFEMKGSDKLYQNNGNGQFSDVSERAGILPDIGFGLNPQVGDLNNDGWLDIYVCNDFRIPDFAYVNNQDGTFTDRRNDLLKHMSFNSMGGDIADINNDGLPDLYTLDMNPEDYIRSKTTMGMTPQSRFEEMVSKNYHYQYMHNMLQVNNGNGTFREIANLAGVANTDWSWACLLADFDLDGFNDLVVTNGVFRDVIDRDANNNIIRRLRENGRKPTDEDFLSFAQMLPQQKLSNYFFRNNGDLTFEDVSEVWADNTPSFSNGATYVDLDNDGDLEVVINNINEPATILKNQAIEKEKGNYLQIELVGPPNNQGGIGATVKIYTDDQDIQYRQMIRSRGFLSSVSGKIHFGLGADQNIQKIEVVWPDGLTQELKSVHPNQLLTLEYANASEQSPPPLANRTLFQAQNFPYRHVDPSFNDYSKQILLPHKLSQLGPASAVADVDQDGLDDIFLGGGKGQAAQLLLGQSNGTFKTKNTQDFTRDQQKEDAAATFFDLENDGDLDLYVASGSYEFAEGSRLLQDRIYVNDGRGNFKKAANLLPMVATTSAVVKAADYDGDGDQDLFVGGRVISGQYPYPPISYLLINNGGQFAIGTPQLAPDLERIGMVTDASWSDLDGDGDQDLLVTGEWMGIEVFLNEGGSLTRADQFPVLQETTGWWNQLHVADIDQDGDSDIIGGNLGLNYKFHANAEKPFHVYTNDFDYNGTVDVFLAKYYNDTEVPVRGKTCTAQQMPHLAQKIDSYNAFANSDLAGILGPGIKSALHYEAREFRSGIFINEGDGGFRFQPFEVAVQQSLINSILYDDFDGDGLADLLMAGNNHLSEIETTRADAGIGYFLKGTGNGAFEFMAHPESGFFADGDVRGLNRVITKDEIGVLVVGNDGEHELLVGRKN